jgi:hypothetical protein
MKIVKNNVVEVKPKKSYPYFGRAKNKGGVIILFTGQSRGMVVDPGTDTNHELFNIETDWVEDIFEQIPNYSITITTED